MSYDFTTLSPEDFELLVADLLSKVFGSQLEIFKAGRDAGIDLRHSRVVPGEPIAIVQCKRYSPHRYGTLKQSVKRELSKLAKLAPKRYLLATSVPLSPANKDELVDLLSPWCQGPHDIFGCAELLALIRDNPHIERAHFKLWISSTSVLERVVHSRIFNLTDATVESAKAQMSKLVVHDGFRRALDVLGNQHHVLIVGNPGIGKTTLARMLMCHYLQEGFEPVVIGGDIGDVWAAIQASEDSKSKMVVLYDDFLGQLRFDAVRFGKNEELSLHEFLDKVRRSNRFRFILTTREYILADARRVHGGFEREADQMARCTVTLNDYTQQNRAKVLFNHLYFSALPESRLRKLVERRIYKDIIEHEHFSPRIVEGISNFANSRAMSDEEYLEYIEREFDDPRAIWDHPFRYQISPTARQLLALLWSFGRHAELTELKEALLLLNAIQPPEEVSLHWHDALRELDGNFINTNRYVLHRDRKQWVTVVEFQNPSVEEYVESFLYGEPLYAERLTEAIVSFAQVDKLVLFATDERHHSSYKAHQKFWMLLDAGAKRLEDKPRGHLVNFSYSRRTAFAQEWWDNDRPSIADRVSTRLDIVSHLPGEADTVLEITKRITSPEYWHRLLVAVPYDDSIAYALNRFGERISEDSSLTALDKVSAGEALCDALVQFLHSRDYMRDISVVALNELAQAITKFEVPSQVQLVEAFRTAVHIAGESAYDNADDSGTLDSDATAVSEIGKLFKLDFKSMHERLRERVDELQSRDLEPDYRPDVGSYSSGDSGKQDYDGLFTDLLDR